MGENENAKNSKRIMKNTLLLYIRMIVNMVVMLFMSRVALQMLGVNDFGVYNVVGGIVSMFAMFSASFSSAISRFTAYELGIGNKKKLHAVFCTSVNIQLLLGLAITVLIEVGGVWFVNHKMVLDPSRLVAANWVLQFSVITFFIKLMSVPYNATILAHERMDFFAYISILETVLNLAALYLLLVSPVDYLIAYSALLMVVALVIRIIYAIYCKRHFEECRYKWSIDKPLLKEMGAFAGWNSVGCIAGVMRSEGVNILINLFFGPAMNAARTISFQVNTAVTQFTFNFMSAVNPQITKSYASRNFGYLNSLLFRSSKFSFFLLLVLATPLLLDTEYVLKLWLGVVPAHTAWFVRLMLIFALLESMASPLITAMLATGKIRTYQLVVGTIVLLNLPIAYVLLELGFPAESTVAVYIVMSVLALAARLVIIKGMITFSIRAFVSQVIVRAVVASVVIFIPLMFGLLPLLPDGFKGLVLLTLATLFWGLIMVLLVGCDRTERTFVREKVTALLHKWRIKG